MRHVALALLALAAADPVRAAEVAPAQVDIEVFDADGGPLGDLTAAVIGVDGKAAATLKVPGTGQLRTRLAPGTWTLAWYHGGDRVGETPVEVAGRTAIRPQVPLYPFRFQAAAQTGDPMVGARAAVRGTGRFLLTLPLLGGVVEGHAPAGDVTAAVVWNGVWVPLKPLKLPAVRSSTTDIRVLPLKVRVVQAGTGLGFGPAQVRVASPGVPPSRPQWTDFAGRLDLALPAGDVEVSVAWFDASRSERARAGDSVQVAFDLSTRQIAAPPEIATPAYNLQIKRPDFQVWAAGTAREGTRLPLGPGLYDLVVFDEQRQPRWAGTATVRAESAAVDVEWVPASRARLGLQPRRLVWSRAASAQPPAVGIADSADWRPLAVAADGALGPLPTGVALRVPNHTLGQEARVGGDVVSVPLGALEVTLAAPGRVKIFDAGAPQRFIVEDCPKTCVIALPPGRYLVLGTAADLHEQAVEIRDGVREKVSLPAL